MKIRNSEMNKVRKMCSRRSVMRFAAAGLSAAMLFGTVASGSAFFGNHVAKAASYGLVSKAQNPNGPNGQNGQNGQPNQKPSDFKLEVECGYNGTVVPDAYMPVAVKVTNLGKDFVGSVQIIVPGKDGSANIMYQKELSLSAGSSKTVTLYVLANSPSNKINVRLMTSKNKQKHSELVRYTSIGAALNCNIGLLTDDIGALSYMDGQYIYPNDNYKTAISELTKDNFPTDWRGLDLLDVIVISNFSTDQLSKEQIAALTYWVERGGLLVVGTGSTGSKTLSGLGSLVTLDGIGEVRQVETTFGLKTVAASSNSEFTSAYSNSGGYGKSSSVSMADLSDYFSYPLNVSTYETGKQSTYTLTIPDEALEDMYNYGFLNGGSQNPYYGYEDDYNKYLEDLWNDLYGSDPEETESVSESESESQSDEVESTEPESGSDTQNSGGGSALPIGGSEGNTEPETEEMGGGGGGGGLADDWLNNQNGGSSVDSSGTGYDSGTMLVTLDASSVYQADFNDSCLASMVYDPKSLDDPYSMDYRNGDYSYLYFVLKAMESGATVTIDPKQYNKLIDLLEANHSYAMREIVRRYFGNSAMVNITDVVGTYDQFLTGDILQNGVYVGSYDLALVKNSGSGMIAVTPFDFTQTPLPGHELSGPMIVSMIQTLIGNKLTDYLNEVISKSNGGYYGGWSSLTPEESRLGDLVDNLKGAGSPAVLLIALLLLLYTLMLPIVYSVYKKKKKILSVWIALPVLGVVFTLLIYLVCMPVRMNKLTLSEAKILEITDGTDTEKIAATAVMPRIKNYRVGFNGSFDVTLLNRDNLLGQIFSGGNYDYDSYKIGILDSVDQIGYEMVSQQVFENIDFLLQRKDDFGSFDNATTYDVFNHLGGTLTNNTTRDLSHAFILIDNEVYYIGEWKIGQTLQLDTLEHDAISKYSWSQIQGQISKSEAIRKIQDRQGLRTLVSFLFGSNGKTYKEEQARRALIEYAFSRYSRSVYTGVIVGISESDEKYGQADDGKWKEYGQAVVYSEIPMNPKSSGGIRNVKPALLPAVDPNSNAYIQPTYEVDQDHTFTVCSNMSSVDLSYVITQSDKQGYFITDLDQIIGYDSSGSSYYYYSYDEFKGTIYVLNHETGTKDEFGPNTQIPLGPDSPYVRNGMMTVTFDLDDGSGYGYSYYNTVLPELYVEKGGEE